MLVLAGTVAPGDTAEAQSSAPTVRRISFFGLAEGDSTYYRGEAVRVRIRFSQQILVDVSGGSPYVDLVVGDETRRARFVRSATNRLDFAYTVQEGDADGDGVSLGANALALNGATVKSAGDSTTDADPAHGPFDGGLAHKVDGSRVRPEPPPAPTVQSIDFFGLAEGDSTYYRGEAVRVRIRFSQQILVDVSGGSPYVDLVVGDETRRARFVRSATNRLDFAYTVQEGDADEDGVSVGANALALDGATVKSAADSATDANPAHDPFDGGLAHKVDGSRVRPEPPPAPTVQSIDFFGLAEGDSTYYRGEAVRVRIRFSQRILVDVSGGSPYVDLVVGDETRRAAFVRSATNRLDFAYTVQEGDADGDGVSVGANALALDGATVKSAADSATDADPAHDPFDGGLAHKVDGSRVRPEPPPAPTVQSIDFFGLAEGDSTYYRGEAVRVRIRFSQRILVDVSGGSPYVDLVVGDETRRAAFVRSATNRLDFAYTVQEGDADGDGVSLGANALALDGATVKSAADSATDADPAHDPFDGGLAHKVDGSRVRPEPPPAPTVQSIDFFGLAEGDSTYYRGEAVRVRIRFSQRILVDVSGGSPYVDLVVGDETRRAAFVRSATNRLDFAYTVQEGDADGDGVSVGANALALDGATVKSAADSATDADPAHDPFDGGLAHKVDGSRVRPEPPPAPTVQSIDFFGLAEGDSTYYRGEAVRVRIRFSQRILVDVSGGSPYVDLVVGDETRRAAFVRSATNRLDFAYTVQEGDADDDGVSVGANALALGGATVKSAADSATDADPAHDPFDGGLAHKVDGSRVRPEPTPAPTVQSIDFFGLAEGDSTYYRGEAVRVRIRFSQRILVDVSGGSPYVDLVVGDETRRAAFVRSATNRLDFAYTVQEGDADDDGVSVGANALALGGATVKSAADSATDANPAHDPFDGGLAHRVDGSTVRSEPTAPTVRRIDFFGLAERDSTYHRGEAVRVRIRFSQRIVVDTSGGEPYVDLVVGDETRRARFVRSATNRLDFAYTVQEGDADGDGVSVGANALALNGATVKSAADSTTDVNPAHDPFDGGLAHRVDGSTVRQEPTAPTVRRIDFFGLAEGDSTYHRGENVRVRIRFSQRIVVDTSGGEPYVDLVVGDETRRARFVRSATNRLDFAYTVQEGDADGDGVGVGANALALNGATVKSAADSTTDANPAHDPFDGGLAHKVDGSTVRQEPTAPTVRRIDFFGLAEGDSTYHRGENVRVRIRFSQRIVVDTSGGEPYVDLVVGDETRRARFVRSATNRLDFAYTVQEGDADGDGVGVGANALALNGATVKSAADSTTDANPAHDPFDGGLAHKVDGSTVRQEPTAPTVRRIDFFGLAEGDSTYHRGENVRVRIRFSQRIVVDTSGGEPYVDLVVGDETRRARFVRSATNRLDFAYTVQEGDADGDGVGVGANALALNGATVKSAADSTTDANPAHDPFDGGLAHKVDGSTVRQEPTAPTVRRIDFFGLAEGDSTYHRGENVRVRIRFSQRIVVDTSGGEPYVDLVVGDETRRARFVRSATNRLDFAYTVQEGDADGDGVGVGANALALNGATVKSAADSTTDANPAHDPFDGGLAHKVDGSTARSPSVTVVTFQNSPTNGDTYGFGEQIVARVVFSDRVLVDETGGTPRLALTVGAQVRQATMSTPTGQRRWLDFLYTVQASDSAPQGVGIGANALALNGGTIKAAADSTTDTRLAHREVPPSATRKVAGSRLLPRLSHDPVAPDPGQKVDGALVAAVFGNRKPELVTPIAPKTLVLKSEPAADDLSAHFRDPDGDVLEFFVVSATEEVATVAVVDHLLTVRPRRPGKSIVTVRAADPQGAEVEHSFQVTVELSRADRTRILKHSLAAFGRTVGTEAVEAIGGRLREGDRENAQGQSHLRLGGRSFSCGASSGSNGCGLDGLARQAYGLLGVRLSPSVDRLASALRRATGDGLDADAVRGLADAFGAPGLGVHDMADAQRPRGNPELGRLLSIDPVWSRDFLSRASFRYSPGGETPSPDGDGQQSSPGGWTFWGQANTGGFEDRPGDDLALDGAVRSAFLGADYRFGRGPLVGLALSRTTSSIGFESGFAGNGTVDVNLTGAYPYVRWSPRPGLNVWGLLGAGRGDADMSEDATGRRFQTDVGMSMAAVGARQAVLGGLAFNADAFAVRTATDETRDLAAVAPSVYRLRFAPEVAGAWAASEQSSIRSRACASTAAKRRPADPARGATETQRASERRPEPRLRTPTGASA